MDLVTPKIKLGESKIRQIQVGSNEKLFLEKHKWWHGHQFAIASTALFIAIGAATDLSLLTSEKSKLQDWADSTALAAAVSGEMESSEFQSFAETFMDSSPFPDARVTTTINEGNLRVGLSQDKELVILSAFGHDAKNFMLKPKSRFQET